jgi:CBS domain-containing protein
VDVKRAGSFPIVHGIRALSIDKGVLAQSTAARIEALVHVGTLERDFGVELVSALRVFMEFRLRAQLEALRRGKVASEALVQLKEISTAERDILRDAMRIVRQFREILRNRYHLSAF